MIGPTGSGKSTLLSIAAGLIKPTSGRVIIDGIDTASSENRALIRKNTGIVFQYPESQLFKGTVHDEVLYGPKNFGLDDIEECYYQAMNSVGLDPEKFRNLSPNTLSGGEQRRVAIACTVSSRPSVLFLDEPTASLDESGIESLRTLIKFFEKAETTLIVATHWPEYFYDLLEKVIIIDGGSIKFCGKMIQIFKENVFRDLGAYISGKEMDLVVKFVREEGRMPASRNELLKFIDGRNWVV